MEGESEYLRYSEAIIAGVSRVLLSALPLLPPKHPQRKVSKLKLRVHHHLPLKQLRKAHPLVLPHQEPTVATKDKGKATEKQETVKEKPVETQPPPFRLAPVPKPTPMGQRKEQELPSSSNKALFDIT